ncbi:protein-disulfide reductase DsbD family protein [Thalassospira australica]|uniref:protein-disulfide reductase DsbD family protein n=1 Tax=Thalassospira australica TaxID=1528106 RepID=UPI00384EC6FF
MIRSLLVTLGLFITALAPLGASAQTAASNWVDEDFASVRLISARDAIAGRDEIRLGLEFDLQPDWKIYWRSAGDAGFPPQLDWTGSANIGNGEIRWPAPHRFSIFGLETFGYKDHVILPIDVPITDPAQGANISLDVDYLVCSDVCIPAQANFTLDIPASLSGDTNGDTAGISRFAHDIEKFASRVPLRGNNLPMSVTDIWQSVENDETVLNVTVTGLDQTTTDPVEILIEGNVRLGFGVPVPTETDDATGTQQFRLPIYGLKDGQTTIGDDMIVTVIAGPLAIEQDRQIAAAPSGSSNTGASTTTPPTGNTAITSLWLIGALALLGGFILNFMPCVLPVLSIKVMSAMKAQGSERSATRRGFLASAAGIITSFWLIALVLIAIKLAGGTIGWGIQFQQPLFLTVMTIIVALFAFNMWGLFEINGPAELGNAANDAITTREQSGSHLGGHFLTGMFATLLATPCSAPFLGTAVGFALAGSNFDIVWIFTLLGIGLAIPYLAIAARPEIARLLPKPGRWMGFVKGVLGVALAGTAIWLLSVLAVQIGMGGAIAVGVALVIAGILLFARHRTTLQKRKFAFTALATLGVLAALFAPGFSKAPVRDTAATETATGKLPWQPFAPDDIARHVADGKTVLVDITADWCVSCQVNKKLVLETAEITDALSADNIVLMQGDWTRPDPLISQYLAGYGRYGIPFNAVFGPKAEKGILLSELLGKKEVLDALAGATGGADLVKN